jgi:transcriptional regulator with XRE-family HTH domain
VFEIGQSLRQARGARGLSLAEVEARTHIRGRYLAALEDERFDLLPGDAYARGFLRTYAEVLDLDARLYAAEYEERFAPHEEQPLAPTGLPPARRQRRLGAIGAACALLALAVAAAFAGGKGGSTASSKQPSTAPHPAIVAPALAATAVVRPHPKAAAAALTLRASRGDCWLLVRAGSASGPVLYSSVLRSGSGLRLAVRKGLWIRLGAPWNVVARVGTRRVTLPALTGDVLVAPRG